MYTLVKNLLILLAFIIMVGSMAEARATTINFPPVVQYMIKYRTNCMVC